MLDCGPLPNRLSLCILRCKMYGLNYISRQTSSAAQPNPLGSIKTSSPKSGCAASRSPGYALHGPPLHVCASPLTNKYARNVRPAISIIEIMIFIAVLSIAVIGTSGYRYFSTLDIHRSDNEITAGRIASYLCESWKGIGGGESAYNPLNDSDSSAIGTIETASSTLAPEKPSSFTLLTNGGYYKVVSDNRIYYVTMSYHSIITAIENLETLNVIVNWPASGNSSNNDAATSKSVCLSELLITH